MNDTERVIHGRFHRLESFIDICENLSLNLRLGNDMSLDVMRRLLEFPPIHGHYAMNCLFSLIKDTVLEYQETKLNGPTSGSPSTVSGSLSNCVNKAGCLQLGEASNRTQFSSGLKDDFVINLHRSLLFSISTYKQYLESLRKCHEACVLAKQNTKETQSQLDKLKNSKNQKKPFWLKKVKSLEELEEKLMTCKVHEAQAGMAFTSSLSDVTEYRESQLIYFSDMLKDDIQRHIEQYLSMSIDNLKDLSIHFPMSEQLLKRLQNFDCWQAAETIYTSLCTRFLAPAYKAHADIFCSVIQTTELLKPADRLSEKPRKAPSHSSSQVCNLDNFGSEISHGNNEQYVWSRDDLSSIQTGQLKLKKGQKVKQKFLSNSGNVAFGWTRRFYGGKKKYGFYLTSNVQ